MGGGYWRRVGDSEESGRVARLWCGADPGRVRGKEERLGRESHTLIPFWENFCKVSVQSRHQRSPASLMNRHDSIPNSYQLGVVGRKSDLDADLVQGLGHPSTYALHLEIWEACFHGCHMSLDKLWIIPHVYHSRNSPLPISSFSQCWLDSSIYLSAPLSSSLTSHFCYYPCHFFTKICVPLKNHLITPKLKMLSWLPIWLKIKFRFSTKSSLLFQEHTHPCRRAFALFVALALNILSSGILRAHPFSLCPNVTWSGHPCLASLYYSVFFYRLQYHIFVSF